MADINRILELANKVTEGRRAEEELMKLTKRPDNTLALRFGDGSEVELPAPKQPSPAPHPKAAKSKKKAKKRGGKVSDETVAAVFAAAKKYPKLSGSELSHKLGLAESTVYYSLRALEGLGKVRWEMKESPRSHGRSAVKAWMVSETTGMTNGVAHG